MTAQHAQQQWYPVVVDDNGEIIKSHSPQRSEGAAITVHTDALAAQHPGVRYPGFRHVLVDLNSLANLPRHEMRYLLVTQPTLRAIFEMGRQEGKAPARPASNVVLDSWPEGVVLGHGWAYANLCGDQAHDVHWVSVRSGDLLVNVLCRGGAE